MATMLLAWTANTRRQKQKNISYTHAARKQHHDLLFMDQLRHATHSLLFLNFFLKRVSCIFSFLKCLKCVCKHLALPNNNPHIFYYFPSFQEFRIKSLRWRGCKVFSRRFQKNKIKQKLSFCTERKEQTEQLELLFVDDKD